jgi:hypothetical protein
VTTDPAYYLKPNPHAGDIVSDITYRVIATHGPGNRVGLPSTSPVAQVVHCFVHAERSPSCRFRRSFVVINAEV